MIDSEDFYFTAEGPFGPDRTQMINPEDLRVIFNGTDFMVEIEQVQIYGGTYDPYYPESDEDRGREP